MITFFQGLLKVESFLMLLLCDQYLLLLKLGKGTGRKFRCKQISLSLKRTSYKYINP